MKTNNFFIMSSGAVLFLEIFLISSYYFIYNPVHGAKPLLLCFFISMVGIWLTWHIEFKKVKYLFLVGHLISLLIFPILIISIVLYYRF